MSISQTSKWRWEITNRKQTSDDQCADTMLVSQPNHYLAASPLGAGRYAFVPGQLASRAGGDTWAEGYISAWNTVPLCTPQFVHSPAARETCLEERKEVSELRTDSHLSRPTTMEAPDLALSLSSLFRVLPLLGKQAIQGSKREAKNLSSKFHNQQDLTLLICISSVGHKAWHTVGAHSPV